MILKRRKIGFLFYVVIICFLSQVISGETQSLTNVDTDLFQAGRCSITSVRLEAVFGKPKMQG